MQQPYCISRGGYFRHPNDDLTFVSVNDINSSQMFSIPSGSITPVAGALFPLVDPDDRFTTFDHSVSFGYDGTGNVYVTRSDNNGGAEVLCYLEDGASDFSKILETPGSPNIVLPRADGTLFLLDDGGSRDFYVLE